MSELDRFRRMKDQFFGSDPQSPLLPEQQKLFTGLSYFDENPALRFELRVEALPEAEQITIQMQTSTGGTQGYTRYGLLHFSVEGQPATLTVYTTPRGHGYFLPFMDATSGEESYSAGRYLDLEPEAGGKVIVDFNMAYDPYCAYNPPQSLFPDGQSYPLWTCPVPPKENRLKVAIRAGERKSQGPWVDEDQL